MGYLVATLRADAAAPWPCGEWSTHTSASSAAARRACSVSSWHRNSPLCTIPRFGGTAIVWIQTVRHLPPPSASAPAESSGPATGEACSKPAPRPLKSSPESCAVTRNGQRNVGWGTVGSLGALVSACLERCWLEETRHWISGAIPSTTSCHWAQTGRACSVTCWHRCHLLSPSVGDVLPWLAVLCTSILAPARPLNADHGVCPHENAAADSRASGTLFLSVAHAGKLTAPLPSVRKSEE